MGILNKLFGKSEKIIIQCDEHEFLVWKWKSKEKTSNQIIPKDYILMVNMGEVAVIVGNQLSGDAFTFIEGPYQNSLGNAYNGEVSTIFFINTQGNNQIKFAVPFFDMADPRNIDLLVPVAVRGSVTFNITDYMSFARLNRLIDFNNEAFAKQTKDALLRYIKSVVANIPLQHSIPLVSLETQISQVNDIVQAELAERFVNDFGVNLKSLDISAISIDKESDAYMTLKSITQDISVKETKHQADLKLKIADAETDIHIKDLKDDQAEKMRVRREGADIELSDKRMGIEEKYRVQREEAELKVKSQESIIKENQFAMHAQTEEAMRTGRIRIGSPQINVGTMTDSLKKGIQIQSKPSNQTGTNLKQTGMMPPMPNSKLDKVYHIAIDNQQTGPYSIEQMKDMIEQGILTSQTMVWQKGTSNWVHAEKLQELSSLFATSQNENTPPPLP